MNLITSFLEKLQTQVEEHLNTQAVFKTIPVFSHQESNFENSINEFVQSGIGICILVLPPLPLRIIPVENQLAFEDIQLRIHVVESACINTTQMSAISVAEHISRILHNFQPPITGWKGWITLNDSQPWKEIKDPQKNGRYTIEINFHIIGSTIKH